jgi:hypothetical protein
MQPAAAAASAASDLCGGAVVQIVECVRYAAELAVGRGRGWVRVQSVHYHRQEIQAGSSVALWE